MFPSTFDNLTVWVSSLSVSCATICVGDGVGVISGVVSGSSLCVFSWFVFCVIVSDVVGFFVSVLFPPFGLEACPLFPWLLLGVGTGVGFGFGVGVGVGIGIGVGDGAGSILLSILIVIWFPPSFIVSSAFDASTPDNFIVVLPVF